MHSHTAHNVVWSAPIAVSERQMLRHKHVPAAPARQQFEHPHSPLCSFERTHRRFMNSRRGAPSAQKTQICTATQPTMSFGAHPLLLQSARFCATSMPPTSPTRQGFAQPHSAQCVLERTHCRFMSTRHGAPSAQKNTDLHTHTAHNVVLSSHTAANLVPGSRSWWPGQAVMSASQKK